MKCQECKEIKATAYFQGKKVCKRCYKILGHPDKRETMLKELMVLQRRINSTD